MNFVLTNAPALFLALPFVMAAVAILVPPRVAVWLAAMTALAIAVMAGGYAVVTQGARPLIYAFGGFAPPAGISFRIDDFSIIPILIVVSVGLVATLHLVGDGFGEMRDRRHSSAAALMLLEIGGLLGLACSADAFNMFVFLEVSSVAAYALVALGGEKHRRGFNAAFEYLVFGAIGASFFVLGVGFLYMATGTLNLADMAARLKTSPAPQLETAGFAFVFAGLALKAGLFPLHGWLPRAYNCAPTFVTLLLAGAGTAVAVSVLVRFGLLTDAGQGIGLILKAVGAPLACAAILWGGLRAVYAKEAREMLSFSAIAEVGFVILAVSIGTHAALTALAVKLIADALAKTVAFSAVASLERLGSGATLESWRGGFSRQPLVSSSLAVALGSTLGAPLTLGFTAKWLLVDAAIAGGFTWIAIVMVVGAVLPLVYGGRAIERLFFKPGLPSPTGLKSSIASILPIVVFACSIVAFGSASGGLVDSARAAATELLAAGGAR